jgi:hypothetical protein
MNGANLVVYKRLKLRPAPSLTHSPLISLEPIGVNTPLVEGLTSYISRLAAAHCISVHNLFREEIAPLIDREALRKSNTDPNWHASLSGWLIGSQVGANGISGSASDWAKALETLTFRRELENLTLLKWRNVLTTRYLMRRCRAWCPACYEEWRRLNKICYEPLLWSIDAVRYCPNHRCELESSCPHCGRENKQLGNTSSSGYCQRCAGWLGRDLDIDATAPEDSLGEDERNYSIWGGDNIGSLLTVSPSLTRLPTPDGIIRSISAYLESYAQGEHAAVYQRLGISRGGLFTWRKGKHLPELRQMLKMSYLFGITLVDLLTGKSTYDGSYVISKGEKEFNESISRPRKKDILPMLESALTESPPPSVQELAERLNYKSVTSLYTASSELCKKISARRLEAFRNQTLRREPWRRVSDAQTIRQALIAAISKNPAPTVREVALQLGYTAQQALYHVWPDLCRELAAKCAAQRKESKVMVRLRLQQLTTEDPPMSLVEAAARLKCKKLTAMRRAFPDLCRLIVERREKYMKKIGCEAEQKLRCELQKFTRISPPISMGEVALQLGYSVGHLRMRFKTLCRKISNRFAEYSKAQKHERRETIRAIIRPAVLQLYNSGTHPSPAKVKNLSPSIPVALTNRRLKSIISEILK